MNYRYALILLLLTCGAALPASAQTIPVSITVTRAADGRPVPMATLRLETLDSSAQVIVLKTDSAGTTLGVVRIAVPYLAEISAPGYAPTTAPINADSSHRAFSFFLDGGKALEGVTVTASRPLIRQDGDVTIVDPEPLAAQSISAYEVLEKTPGIVADQDGNFFLSSTSPSIIYINGREMKMSNADVATMLRSLPPASIERIEIMRTPSAKADASGGGGIINIVLKRGVKVGLTGSVNAAVQQGFYGNQNVGGNLSYSDGERSAYLNLNVAKRKSLENISSIRYLNTDSMLGQDAGTVYDAENMYLGYGAGKTFGPKWDVNYDGRLSGNFSDNKTENTSLISQRSDGGTVSDNRSFSGNDNRNWNIDQSLGAKYKLDTAGSEWTALAAWNGTFGANRQDLSSTFVQPAGDGFSSSGDVATQRHNYIFQTDLKWKARYRLTVETGLKASITHFTHGSDFTVDYNGGKYPDPYRSLSYRYDERIGAAYLQASKTLGKDIILKSGLRLETTDMQGVQTRPGSTEFGIHRADLFPYLYLSKKVMEIAGYELRAYLVYRKTIQRPAYDYLNPYQRFIDQYLYETGNPALRPQFTHNYEANVSVDDRPLLAVGWNDVQDIFSNVIYQRTDAPSLAYRTWDNLGRNQEFYVRALGAIPPGKVYFFVLGGQYNLNKYDGFYNGAPLQYTRATWTAFTYHTLKLGKRSQLSVNGFMRFKSLVQFTEVGTFGALNASLNRQFLDRKLMVTVSAQDIFFTNRYDYSLRQGPIDLVGERYNDSRRVSVSVRYNFGVKTKEEKKEFMGGAGGEEH